MSETKRVRFDFTLDPRHAARKDWHDGLGGVHKQGAVVTLPAAAADDAVGAKAAVFVDGQSSIQVHRERDASLEAHRIAEQQARSKAVMAMHDNLPKAVRRGVHEHGDEVAHDYIEQQRQKLYGGTATVSLRMTPLVAIEGADVLPPTRRKRGRLPKAKGDVQ